MRRRVGLLASLGESRCGLGVSSLGRGRQLLDLLGRDHLLTLGRGERAVCYRIGHRNHLLQVSMDEQDGWGRHPATESTAISPDLGKVQLAVLAYHPPGGLENVDWCEGINRVAPV